MIYANTRHKKKTNIPRTNPRVSKRSGSCSNGRGGGRSFVNAPVTNFVDQEMVSYNTVIS